MMRWTPDLVDNRRSRLRRAIARHAPGPCHLVRVLPRPTGGRTQSHARERAITGQNGRPPVPGNVPLGQSSWEPAGEPHRHPSAGTHPQAPIRPCEDLLYIQLQGRAPRAGAGFAAVHAKAPRDGGADCGAAQHLPITGWPPRGPWRAGAPAAFLWPFGPRRRRRALIPATGRTGCAPQRQRWRAVLQTGPSLRRRILKPCVLAVKIARCARVAARSLRASGPLRRRDSEGACRRDGQD